MGRKRKLLTAQEYKERIKRMPPPTPEAIANLQETQARATRFFLEAIVRQLRPGTLTAAAWTLLDKRNDDAARMEAAKRFLGGPPVSPQRWRAIKGKIEARLKEDHPGKSFEEALELRTFPVLVQIASEMGIGDTQEEAARHFLARMDALVPEEILGEGWRQEGYDPLPEEFEELPEENRDAEAIDVDMILRKAKLTPMESAVLGIITEGGKPGDAAEELGISPGAARVHYRNAKRKILPFIEAPRKKTSR